MSFAGSLGAFAENFANGQMARRSRDERAEDRAQQDRYLSIMEKNPVMMGSGLAMGAVPPNEGAVAGHPQATGGVGLWGLLSAKEGGGDFDTLYGHSQREGGRFAGVRPSQMSLDELYDFTKPSGEYGQWVAARNGGIVGTPLGAGQIVGRTLRSTAQAMGLPGSTKFSPEVQNSMISHLARNRLQSAKTPEAKRSALRSEWQGFRSVNDATLDAAIGDFESRGRVMGATPPVY